MTKFYRLLADPEATSRWHIKAPVDALKNEVDARLFTQSTKYQGSLSLVMPLRRRGDLVDFNFGDFDMVVTPEGLNVELEHMLSPQIQRIPVKIENGGRGFEILNVLDVVKCVDEQRSEFTKWTNSDGRSDKVGKFRMITRLRIDAKAASAHHLFRVAEWPIALIASEDIKSFLEARAVTGITFELVS